MKNKTKGGSQRFRGSRHSRSSKHSQGSQSRNSTLKKSQQANRTQSRQSKYKRSVNPLNILAQLAGQMQPLPVPNVRPPFVPLPAPAQVARVIPNFVRYIPTMPDGSILNARDEVVVPTPDDIVIPPSGNVPIPPGPIPQGITTNTAQGTSKKVFFHANSNVAYITSTPGQMAITQDTNEHFREELILTQIDHFLFPDVLGAYRVGPENEQRIQSYRQTNPTNIFIYKKRKVRESTSDSPGIIEFILDSILRLSRSRMGEPIPLSFTNLDIKPQNIGILPDGRFIFLDNGSIMLSPVPNEFREYYERSALIIGLCNLDRVFTPAELRLIRPRLTRRQLYDTFRRELTQHEKIYITEYARRFFIAQGLPLTADNGVLFPEDVMKHYCKIIDTRIRYNDFLGKFREVTQYNRLDAL